MNKELFDIDFNHEYPQNTFTHFADSLQNLVMTAENSSNFQETRPKEITSFKQPQNYQDEMKAFTEQLLGNFMAEESYKSEANEITVDMVSDEDLQRDIVLLKSILRPHLLGKNKIAYSKPQ